MERSGVEEGAGGTSDGGTDPRGRVHEESEGAPGSALEPFDTAPLAQSGRAFLDLARRALAARPVEAARLARTMRAFRERYEDLESWERFERSPEMERARDGAFALSLVLEAVAVSIERSDLAAASRALAEAAVRFRRSWMRAAVEAESLAAGSAMSLEPGRDPWAPLLDRLEARERTVAGEVFGAAMARSAVASFLGRADLFGAPSGSPVRVVYPVLVGKDGELRRFEVEAHTAGAEDQDAFLYPDPIEMGFVVLLDDLRDALDVAWRSTFERNGGSSPRVRVRFRVVAEHPDPLPSGRSGGAAYHVAFSLLLEPASLGRFAVAAACRDDGRFGPLDGANDIASVLLEKALAVARAGIGVLVVSSDEPVAAIATLHEDERLRALRVVRADRWRPAAETELSGTTTAARRFLERLPDRAFERFGKLLPIVEERIADSLLPPHVSTDAEFRERFAKLDSERGGAEVDALRRTADDLPAQELVLRRDLFRDFEPVPLAEVADASARTILRGEPTDGKTIALIGEIDRRARDILRELDASRAGIHDASILAPLFLPLRELGDRRRGPRGKSSNLLELAVEASLDVAFGKDDGDPGVSKLASKDGVGPGDRPATTSELRRATRTWLEWKAARGQVRLYLDALDETPARDEHDTELREWLIQRFALEELRHVPVFLTTRPYEELERYLPGAPVLVVAPWSDEATYEAVERYFSRWPGPDGDRQTIVGAIQAHLRRFERPRRLVRLPILANALCRIKWSDPSAALPDSRAAVLESGLFALVEHTECKARDVRVLAPSDRKSLRRRFALETTILERVAWRFWGAKNRPLLESELEREVDRAIATVREEDPSRAATLSTSAQDVIEAWVTAGILQPRGEALGVHDVYRFSLLLFHEHFAARELAKRVLPRDATKFAELLRAPAADWPDPPWADAPREERPSPEERLLERPAWEHLWILLAGELDPDRFEALLQAAVERMPAADGESENTDANPRLVLLAARVEAAGSSIARNRLSAEREKIVGRLEVSSRSVQEIERDDALRALIECDRPESDRALLALLEDGPNGTVRAACARALAPALARERDRSRRESWMAGDGGAASFRVGLTRLLEDPAQPHSVRAACLDVLSEAVDSAHLDIFERVSRSTFATERLADGGRSAGASSDVDAEAEATDLAERALGALGRLDISRAAALVEASAAIREAEDLHLGVILRAAESRAEGDPERFAEWKIRADAEGESVLDRLVRSREYQELDSLVVHGNDDGSPEVFRVVRHVASGMEFVRIPAREFSMGSPLGEHERWSSERLHRVRLRPYLIGRHTVWVHLFRQGSSPPVAEFDAVERLPVTRVSWKDARDFCRMRGWLLPSEAEWECACRAGTRTPFSFGETISASDVNFNGNHPYREGDPQPEDPEVRRRGKTVPVGSLPANAWGLHEMHGNVWEWCHDVFDARFYGRREAAGPNPLCLSGSELRLLRGGSWFFNAGVCRSAIRFRYHPWWRIVHFGFRPARPLL